ncbi:hypothetical protein EAI_06787 [Harpegnathos saltator]|uniref:Uncharacterized protein n=1 Tax=Harpegnathos saltator TaxID=610380 RepID=E2BB19_HARSA|nr:hypothetical protein EAI_06787 [Harpegnathos saltator]
MHMPIVEHMDTLVRRVQVEQKAGTQQLQTLLLLLMHMPIVEHMDTVMRKQLPLPKQQLMQTVGLSENMEHLPLPKQWLVQRVQAEQKAGIQQLQTLLLLLMHMPIVEHMDTVMRKQLPLPKQQLMPTVGLTENMDQVPLPKQWLVQRVQAEQKAGIQQLQTLLLLLMHMPIVEHMDMVMRKQLPMPKQQLMPTVGLTENMDQVPLPKQWLVQRVQVEQKAGILQLQTLLLLLMHIPIVELMDTVVRKQLHKQAL